ncbi:hypothetical protein GCM10027431_23090 [Lysobacter rhizosphaerae]
MGSNGMRANGMDANGTDAPWQRRGAGGEWAGCMRDSGAEGRQVSSPRGESAGLPSRRQAWRGSDILVLSRPLRAGPAMPARRQHTSASACTAPKSRYGR